MIMSLDKMYGGSRLPHFKFQLAQPGACATRVQDPDIAGDTLPDNEKRDIACDSEIDVQLTYSPSTFLNIKISKNEIKLKSSESPLKLFQYSRGSDDSVEF
jgi:hypothetical protein